MMRHTVHTARRLLRRACAVAGAGLALLCAPAGFAQDEEAAPPAYFISTTTVVDPDSMGPYRDVVGPSLEAYGAKGIVASNAVEFVEGEETYKRIVIIEFPSMEALHDWYQSEEYQAVIPLRRAATTGSTVVFAEGMAPM